MPHAAEVIAEQSSVDGNGAAPVIRVNKNGRTDKPYLPQTSLTCARTHKPEKPLAAAQRRKLSGNSAVTSDKTAADNSEKARMPNACSALHGSMRQSTPESTVNNVT